MPTHKISATERFLLDFAATARAAQTQHPLPAFADADENASRRDAEDWADYRAWVRA